MLIYIEIKLNLNFVCFLYIIMRPVQAMRYGRRMTLTNRGLAPSMKTSFSLQSLSTGRNSILSYPYEQNREIQQPNNNNNLFRER